jgi:hypothetical protein
MIVIHVRWNSFSEGRGLLGIRFNGDFLELRQLSGRAPSPIIAGTAVMFAVREALERYPELNLELEPIVSGKVERYEGTSGCVDYRVRYIRDIAMKDAPLRGKLHVSMYGKLNQGFSGLLQDFIVTLSEAVKDFPGIMDAEYRTWFPVIKEEDFAEKEMSLYETIGMC